MSYYKYPKYVSVAEKKEIAAKKLKQLKKKNPDIRPVTIEGKSLANTWWGKEWNKNLERYADYSNRIGRGRSYLRHGAVLDLKIEPGNVAALVQGSGSKPYSVSITIKPIPPKNWAAIKKTCKGQMNNLKQLLAGQFPKELGSVFTQEGNGLFPVPNEIDFNCSCPDSASMCKHLAATLYGIGTRLDQDPNLFFVLRKIDINELISETVKESKKELLSKAGKKTSRIIEDESGLSELFGVDLGDHENILPARLKKATKKNIRSEKANTYKITENEFIEQMIRKRKKGIAVSELIEKSGFKNQKVRNIVFQLKSRGKIENVSRGFYKWLS